MTFTLHKTRINTDFSRLRKHFSLPEDLSAHLQCDYKISLLEPLTVLNLESASIKYRLQNGDRDHILTVNFMQTTRLTTRCFDVYYHLSPPPPTDLDLHLKQSLETLREKYNGTWHITDADLILSILK